MLNSVYLKFSLLILMYPAMTHANEVVDYMQESLSVDAFAERKNLVEDSVSKYSGITLVKETPQNNTAGESLEERTRMIDESLERYAGMVPDQGVLQSIPVAQQPQNVQPMRDPFNASINQMNVNGMPNRFGNSTFLPNNERQKIPTLKLKGVVNLDKNNEGDLLALLQINKTDSFMVRVGDEISYDPTNPTAAIKIMSITRLSVKVQVGSLGNVLIVR